MKTGVYNSMFTSYTPGETALRMKKLGMEAIQLFPKFEGKQLQSVDLTREYCSGLKEIFAEQGIEIVALCGYQNIVAHDPDKRRAGILELEALIPCCPDLGCRYLVTETGSTNPVSGWNDHPDNYTDDTWEAMAATLKALCRVAADNGVEVCIEPHFAQVTKTTDTMVRMLEMADSQNLKLVYDPANLITPENAERADDILRELFEKTGDSLALLHAKDTVIRNCKPVFVPAGQGVLNYALYAELSAKQGYSGPVILEYVSEEKLPGALQIVREAFK